MRLPIFLLLEIALFSGGTWACPKPATKPCALCPDNSFYATDRCDDPDGCVIFPPEDVITSVKDPNGCKRVRIDCPEGSMIRISYWLDGEEETRAPELWSTFKERGWNDIVCKDFLGSIDWYYTTVSSPDYGSALIYAYCYNKNNTVEAE